jgi:hypothetical protein
VVKVRPFADSKMLLRAVRYDLAVDLRRVAMSGSGAGGLVFVTVYSCGQEVFRNRLSCSFVK